MNSIVTASECPLLYELLMVSIITLHTTNTSTRCFCGCLVWSIEISFVGKIKLFIKGADSMIRERLAKNKVDYEEITWKQLEVRICYLIVFRFTIQKMKMKLYLVVRVTFK